MDQQNAKIEKLEESLLESQQKMAINFNEFQRKLESIQDQQRTMVLNFDISIILKPNLFRT
jgi:hypothetical protein